MGGVGNRQQLVEGRALAVLGEDDVLGDDAVEALDESGVVAGQRGQLGVHALPRDVLQQGAFLNPEIIIRYWKFKFPKPRYIRLPVGLSVIISY